MPAGIVQHVEGACHIGDDGLRRIQGVAAGIRVGGQMNDKIVFLFIRDRNARVSLDETQPVGPARVTETLLQVLQMAAGPCQGQGGPAGKPAGNHSVHQEGTDQAGRPCDQDARPVGKINIIGDPFQVLSVKPVVSNHKYFLFSSLLRKLLIAVPVIYNVIYKVIYK